MSETREHIGAAAEIGPQQEGPTTRRDALRTLGRFAAVTPPSVGLLLAAASRPAHAAVISCPPDDTCDEIVDDVAA